MTHETIKVFRPVDKKWPITCKFGVEGKHWKSGFHQGVDFGVPVGSDVFCAFDGEIQISGFEKSFGARIWVLSKHPEFGQIRHLYAHLSTLFVEKGNKVKRGELLAFSGNTGNSTGAHLHFQAETWPSRKILRPTFDAVEMAS